MTELKFKLFFLAICIFFELREIKGGVYSSFKPSYPFVAVLNCSLENPSIYYDMSKQKWKFQRYSTCSSTEKDILSLCERVYPQYYIMSISQYRHKIKYFLNECKNITKTNNFETQNLCQYKIEYTYPFKCIYEVGKSTEEEPENYEMPFTEIDTTKIDDLETSFVTDKVRDDQDTTINRNEMVTKQNVAKSGKFFLNIVFVLVLIVAVAFLGKKISKFYKDKKRNDYDFNLNNPALQDDHVNNMQVNGYENPAYKLYEQNIVT